MSHRVSSWACRLLLVASAFGCSRSGPGPLTTVETASLVTDVTASLADGGSLPEEVSISASRGFDLRVSYVPGTAQSEAYGKRAIQPHDVWHIAALIYRLDGHERSTLPVGFFELNRFEPTSDAVGPPPGGFVVVTAGETPRSSPAPPPNMDPQRDYFWQWVPLPAEAGEYELQLSVYPACDPPSQMAANVSLGPGAVIHTHRFSVAP